MPDISSVLTTVTQNLVTPIYPNGTGQPSIVGVQVTIGEGWPIRTQLDKDLQAGNAHVSVFPTTQERVVTKFERIYQPSTLTAPTIVLTTSGTNQITITGTVSIPQSVMAIVNGTGYAYGIVQGDTLDTIATNWAAVIPNATAMGNVITITQAYSLKALVSTPYTAAQEIARMERVFMISCWCPSPTIRATLGAAIDVYMKENYRIQLADNFWGQVFYSHLDEIDMLEKSLIYRRDLNYIIQYPTTITNNYVTVADAYVNSITLDYGKLT